MKSLVLAVFVSLSFSLASTPVHADETITVVADSMIAGNAGFVLLVEASDGSGQSISVFEEAGKLRIYGFREFGSNTWDVLSSPQYLVPTQSMTIGDTWDYIENEFGDPMQAEVVDFVGVTVTAGTFDAYMVDITNLNNPGSIAETIWFVDGVGFVLNQGYLPGGAIDWQDELLSYSIVGGSGFMPMAVGNTWSHVEISVLAKDHSWGELKAQY